MRGVKIEGVPDQREAHVRSESMSNSPSRSHMHAVTESLDPPGGAVLRRING